MKIIVRENDRGFLFKDGVFQRILLPGSHRVYKNLGYSFQIHKAQGQVTLDRLDPKLLLRDAAFAAMVTAVDVPDNHIAIHSVDGRVQETLTAGEYLFWSVYQRHTVEILDIGKPDAAGVASSIFLHIPLKLYTKVEVQEGECGLLYFDGAYQRLLESGTHYFWNNAVKVTCLKVDLRIQQVEVSGQEILTADKVGLRLNFLFRFRVVDPVRLVGQHKDFGQQIYSAVQLALRKYVGRYRLDELLEQKNDIADYVLEKLREQQEALYVEFSEAGLKDIILPGEIRSIMNTVLVAEKNAQANVIARREETASTRSLLNTAKLLDENETLRRLKELEYLERICDRVGNISVGGGNLLEQLRDLMAAG